uniref:Uncharacterized protein n=1 Tax=Cacopsylla melanoneura TaxID=428564 RepID=A0A8D8VPP6_9HEMI
MRKQRHARDVRFHLRTIRIVDGNVDFTDVAVVLKHAPEHYFARVIRFQFGREPFHWQIGQIDCVGPFPRFHFVHVPCVAEVRVPIVPRREVGLGFRCADFETIRISW